MFSFWRNSRLSAPSHRSSTGDCRSWT